MLEGVILVIVIMGMVCDLCDHAGNLVTKSGAFFKGMLPVEFVISFKTTCIAS